MAVPPPRFFPLDTGSLWSYVEERPGADAFTISVEGFEDGLTVVDFNGVKARIQDRQAELDIELPGKGLVPYYRFNEDSWLHHDVFDCNGNRTLTAASRDDVVETPAGTFTDCLRLEYGPGLCADAGRVAEWWKLEVGLVKWIDDSFIGPRVHVLASFTHEGPAPTFRRGDVDDDGELVLSDAIFALNYLFLGGKEPACQDAADVNDDGKLDIGDPIFLLGFLFLGSAPPPAPGPADCGEDPSEDALPACSAGCKQGFDT